MAQVDFSNAIITPNTSNILYNSDLTLYNNVLRDVSGNSIVRNSSIVSNIAENTVLKLTYSGEFLASGTEFYIGLNNDWRVSNISFSSGDTYTFSIRADLTCE